MTDITTIEEVTAGKYTVRVGANDSGGYDAVVLDEDGDAKTIQYGMMGMLTSSSSTSSDGEDELVKGPAVTAPHKWVAVGFAIEAYEWQHLDEETVSVDRAYRTFSNAGVSGVEVDVDEILSDLEDDADE